MSEQPTEGLRPVAVAKPPSIWDELTARRDAVAEDRFMDLPLPGWEDRVGLRLSAIAGDTQAAVVERQQRSRSKVRDINLNADLIIKACRSILARPTPESPWEEQLDEDGEPYRLDERFARALGHPELSNARMLLRYLFGFAPSPDLAIQIAGGQYAAWASASEPEMLEEALGEET